ncbi:SAM dependent carboxyl methyltransferase [Macleaya cordata]|uniref:SAM dependent carboxyl methyltransferase n=1 Tax=Macleaya cordata TaxID=56857 RepID=A0A200QT87_MACCD|nr:SAM dependent carboxyl methyltransferase [Macleaya cordata]
MSDIVPICMQREALDMVKHITIDTITDLYITTTPDCLSIADLGCSSGPNTLSVVRDLIEAVDGTCCKILRRPPPEFKELSAGNIGISSSSTVPSVFIAGVPGSFYRRLFPTSSLHFIHSSHTVHWLSRVPPWLYDEEGKPINKGNIYISESSPEVVFKAYLSQFQDDFSVFLRSRSEELVPGGRMVLLLLGRKGSDHSERGVGFLWELLARCIA